MIYHHPLPCIIHSNIIRTRLVIPCIHYIALYSGKLLLLKKDIIFAHKHHQNTFPLNGISKNHQSLQMYFPAIILNHLHITLIGNKEARGQQSSKHTCWITPLSLITQLSSHHSHTCTMSRDPLMDSAYWNDQTHSRAGAKLEQGRDLRQWHSMAN